VERDLFCDAVRRAADGAGDMRAVSVAVVGAVSVVDGRESVADPAGELLMGRAQPGVDDVGLNALPGLVVGRCC
jgi:hypothetical protein